jgi:hypothetical protein
MGDFANLSTWIWSNRWESNPHSLFGRQKSLNHWTTTAKPLLVWRVLEPEPRRLHYARAVEKARGFPPHMAGYGAEGQVSHPRLTSVEVHLAVRRLLHGGSGQNRTDGILFTRQALSPTRASKPCGGFPRGRTEISQLKRLLLCH